MDKEITLALLTPRSGALNYRYLIPEGVSYSDMQLGEIRNALERSEKDRPGLLFQCEARQLGGRMGTEALIFHVPDFQRYPQEDQKQCRELLQDWFENKRDAVIQAIDWSAYPNTQTIAIPELTRLRNQLNEFLSKPEKIDQSSGSVPVRISSFFMNVLIIMAALILTILLISVPNNPIGDLLQKMRGDSNVQEQEQKLLKQLSSYNELFAFPNGTTNPSITDYQNAFNDLYRYCEQHPLNPVDKYLQEEYVKSIKQQKIVIQYPVFGNVPEKNRTALLNNVKGVSPVQLRRIFAAYKKMKEALSNEPDNSVFISKINNEFKIDFPAKEHADNLIVNPKDMAQPLFFVQSGSAKELEWAMTIHDFIFSIIKDEYGDEINSDLSQKPLLSLIQTKSFNNLFNNINCESDELRAALEDFYSVLKEIAKSDKN